MYHGFFWHVAVLCQGLFCTLDRYVPGTVYLNIDRYVPGTVLYLGSCCRVAVLYLGTFLSRISIFVPEPFERDVLYQRNVLREKHFCIFILL